MTKAGFRTVDEYIAAQPEAAQRILERVRETVRKAVPEAEEVISYDMPTYKLHGELVLHFAGWKQHYSIYPMGADLAAAFKTELAGYKVDRSTIRFPLSEGVPVDLIEHIAKFRAKRLARD